MFLVTGSQADRPEKNKVTLLKITDLHKTHINDDSEDEDADDEDENLDEDPTIEHVNVNHMGGVNRIRNMPQHPGIVATMADTAHNHIFDLSHVVKSMSVSGPRAAAPTKPIFSFQGHREEGYALDWSPVVAGRLATGDCQGKIHLWNPTSPTLSSWQVDTAGTPGYQGHRSSVEDLQWSPTEATVFASCSSDRTVRIWDIRDRTKSQITWDAHSEDVNVITWNRNVGYLLASGCDDGSFKVWDLRQVSKKGPPLANFTFHHAPITSIEWAPHDESMLAASSADNQISIWDLSVEADEDEVANRAANGDLADYPPQLLFLHMGQTNIKEIHFHPQIPGTLISTAEDSFNIFKPAITVSST